MQIYKIPEILTDEITQYEKLIEDYKNGKIDKQQLRAHRVPMGVYEQRKNDTYMVRIRIPGGNISLSQFENLINIAKKYTEKPLHITTRQELQLHYIKLEDTVKIMKELKEIGLSTRGGGGNTVRNIIGSYDSGLSKKEIFDITPYVIALTERFISEADSWVLPRKFKIAFSNSSEDTGFATVNDLGFIAKINENGEKGFSVYIAGGMGANSNAGIKIFDFIPESEVYNVAKATKNLFDKYGNRKNRHKARLRFVLYKFGKEEFIKKFFEEYKEVKSKNYAPLELKIFNNNLKLFVEIPIFLGDLDFKIAEKIIDVAKDFGELSLRFTPRQNILIKDISENQFISTVERLIKQGLIKESNNKFLENAISCAGASTCRLGICLSKNLLLAIKERLERDGLKIKNLDNLKINISGCPNSCGQHLLADIGFFGKAKKVNDRYVPYYYVVAGARIGEDKTSFAEKLGEIAAYDIPQFLEELLINIDKQKRTDESFYDFYQEKGKQLILEKLKKYQNIPSYNENKNYYYDWYEKKEFSILEKVEGECSAGLFDLIDFDFSRAEEEIEKENYHNAVYHICNSLLITKGLEAKTKSESVMLFKQNFISKHIDGKYESIIDKYLNMEILKKEEVKELYMVVKELYNQMDNSLKFPELKKEENKNIENINFRDFRGVPCPLNFVKVKLVLETMQKSEILKIFLDDGEPIQNVPASLKSEGYEILNIEKIENYYSVLIKK